MRRLTRGWWRWALALALLVALLLVLAVGVLRVLIAAMPAYRHGLVQRVEAAVGQPVTVGRIHLGWSGWTPTLTLDRVRVMGTPRNRAVATLGRVRLSFPLPRLIRNDWTPARVVLLSPSVSVRRDAGGNFHIAGFSRSTHAAAKSGWRARLQKLSALSAVRIREGRISLTGMGRPMLNGRYTHIKAHFGVEDDHAHGAADADLPGRLGAHGRVSFQLTDLDKAAKTRVKVRSLATGLLLQPWLANYLRSSERINGRIDRLSFDAVYAHGRWQTARARLETGPVSANSADTHSLTPIFTHFYAIAGWRGGQAGWSLQLRRIDPGLPGAAAGSTAPDLRASLTYQRGERGQPGHLEANLPRLPLAAVAPWLRVLRSPLPRWAADTSPSGEIRQLVVNSRLDGGAISVDGVIVGVDTRVAGRVPGVTGVTGRFHADLGGGNMALSVRGGLLQAPHALTRPVPISQLSARVHWQQNRNGWLVRADDVSIRALGAAAHGSLDLELPSGKPPQLLLRAGFSAASVTRLKGLIPAAWPDEVQRWLRHAIAGGRVDNGHLKIMGALPDFPFVGKPGVFDVNFDAHRGELDYADNWPIISGIDAHLDFQGLSMRIDANQASILGTPLARARASIADFRHAVLRVRGRANADVARQLEFVARSPLRRANRKLLQTLKARGPGTLDLRLWLPLDNIDAGRYSGDIALRGDRIDYAPWPHPITGVKGRLHFSGDGLEGSNIAARTDRLDFSVDLEPLPQSHASRLTATTRLAFPRDQASVSDYVPEVLLSRLSGSSLWQLQTDFSGASAGALKLSSNLNGTAIALPEPVGKPPARAGPLDLRISHATDGVLQVAVNAVGTLDTRVRLRRVNTRWRFDRGDIRFGAKAALPATAGLTIDGRLPSANAAHWLRFAHSLSGEKAGASGAGGSASLLRKIDLHVGEITGYGQHWANVDLRVSPIQGGWMVTVASPDAAGLVKVLNRVSGGRRHVVADMGRLNVAASSLWGKASTGRDASAAPIDPGALPTLDFECVRCSVDDVELGNVKATATALADGLQLRELRVNGRDLDVDAHGRWTRSDGNSRAALHLSAVTARIADLIRAMGFTPSVRAKSSHAKADLQWRPVAGGLALTHLHGRLSLKMKDGTLVAVDPGAGRVLGLINFYALPRRLLLNFRDVTDKGLAFDSVSGRFNLRGGSAYTDDEGLRLHGPSLRMVMKGRIGLAARDYDETVTVYPGLGSTLPIAGAVLGGPAVGAFVLLAQKLLDKPLDALTNFSYHLGGTWSNPRIGKGQ